MKGALGASIKAEEQAVTDRFQRAENVLSQVPEKPEMVYQEPPTKVTRDSFTMPSSDYDLIATTKSRCLTSGMGVTKSEILRAGLHALQGLSEDELRSLLGGLEKVKTGRPTATV